MLIKRTVGEKGQVVLPKDIRDQLGIKPGTEVAFDMTSDGVIIRKATETRKAYEDFFDIGPKLKHKIDIKKTIEEQYEVR